MGMGKGLPRLLVDYRIGDGMDYLIGCVLLSITLLVCVVLAFRGTPSVSGYLSSRQESYAIGLLVTVTVVLIFHSYLFGSDVYAFNDIGSDTTQQYLPLYLDMLHDLRNGDFSFWNSNFGTGASILSYQSLYFDPFNSILLLVGLLLGDSSVPFALVLTQIIKMYSCAFIFKHLCAFYCKHSTVRIFASWAYSCNGFLMLWGNHYFLGTASVVVALLLLCIENLIRSKSFCGIISLCLTIAVLTLSSAYIAFMAIVQCAIYSLLRCLYLSDNLKQGCKKFAQLVFPVVSGLLIGCVLAVPVACLLLFDSVRIAGGNGLAEKVVDYLTSFPDWSMLFYSFSRLMGNNFLTTGRDASFVSNYYEIPQIGCSAGFLFLLILFIFWVWKHRESKLRTALLVTTLVLSMLYFTNNFLPAFLNVFAGVSYRSTFMFSCLGSLLMAFVFDLILDGRVFGLGNYLSSGGLSLVFLLACFFVSSDTARIICAISLSALLIAIVCIIASRNRRAFNKFSISNIALVFAFALISGTVVIDSYFTINYRNPLQSYSFPSTEHVEEGRSSQAIEWIKGNDDSAYRIEKNFAEWSVFQDGLIQGYDGTTSYNSTRPKEEIDFLNHIWMGNSDGSDIHVYTSYAFSPDNCNAISLLGVKYILSGQQLNYDWLQYLHEVNGIYIYRNLNWRSLCQSYYSYVEENDIDKLSGEEKSEIIMSGIDIVDTSADFIPFVADSPADFSVDCTASDVEKVNQGEYLVSTNNSDPSITTLSVFNSPGWMATVDGEGVEVFSSNYGFVSIYLPSGTHKIKFYYRPYGLDVGFGLTLLGIATLLVQLYAVRGSRL